MKLNTSVKVSMMSSLAVIMPLVLGIIGMIMFRLLVNQSTRLAAVSVPTIRNMTLVDMMHDGIRANVLDALRVGGGGSAEEKASVQSESKEFAANIEKWLAELAVLPVSPETKKMIDDAKPEVEHYGKLGSSIVEQALNGKKEEAEAQFKDFMARFEVLEEKLGQLGDSIENEAKMDAERANDVAGRIAAFGLALIVIFTLFGGLIALWTLRDLKEVLRSMVDRLTVGADKFNQSAIVLNDNSARLDDSSAEESRAINSTAHAITEIEMRISKVVSYSDQLRQTTVQNTESAQRGQQAMREMSHAFADIQQTNEKLVRELQSSMAKTEEFIKVIHEIAQRTTIINDIVFQTKLLSFNASVEAARAAEHGRGFTVVAEEVGNLANMSGKASKEIQELLTISIEKVRSTLDENRQHAEKLTAEAKAQAAKGEQVAVRCQESLLQIVQEANNVFRTVQDINAAISEQRGGMTEISQAVQRLTESNGVNVEAFSQTKEQANTLQQLSGDVNGVINELTRTLLGESDKAA